jgi:hypothetical protein
MGNKAAPTYVRAFQIIKAQLNNIAPQNNFSPESVILDFEQSKLSKDTTNTIIYRRQNGNIGGVAYDNRTFLSISPRFISSLYKCCIVIYRTERA